MKHTGASPSRGGSSPPSHQTHWERTSLHFHSLVSHHRSARRDGVLGMKHLRIPFQQRGSSPPSHQAPFGAHMPPWRSRFRLTAAGLRIGRPLRNTPAHPLPSNVSSPPSTSPASCAHPAFSQSGLHAALLRWCSGMKHTGASPSQRRGSSPPLLTG